MSRLLAGLCSASVDMAAASGPVDSRERDHGFFFCGDATWRPSRLS